MSAKSETAHIRGEGCICDPFDLAAMGHMTNCPRYIIPAKDHKDVTEILRAYESGEMDAAGAIEDLVELIDKLEEELVDA